MNFTPIISAHAPCAVSTDWIPGVSGGDHAAPWPEKVTALLRKRLSSQPRCSYSFAASEVERLLDFKIDRAQARRWAIENGLAHHNAQPKASAPIRRWQRSAIGELWQLDATPHRWFSASKLQWPMLNMLDDCSRLFVASKIYEREILLSYFDLLPRGPLSISGCPWLFMSITTACSLAPSRMRSLNWAGPCASTASPFDTLPPRKPKAKWNASINTGRDAFRLTLPVNKSTAWTAPTPKLTSYERTATAARSTANWG